MTFKPDQKDPMATLMLTMLAAFAAFERDLIRERQAEGIALAKARGVYKGGQPKLTPAQAQDLLERAAKGETKVALAGYFGISRQAVYDYLNAA